MFSCSRFGLGEKTASSGIMQGSEGGRMKSWQIEGMRKGRREKRKKKKKAWKKIISWKVEWFKRWKMRRERETSVESRKISWKGKWRRSNERGSVREAYWTECHSILTWWEGSTEFSRVSPDHCPATLLPKLRLRENAAPFCQTTTLTDPPTRQLPRKSVRDVLAAIFSFLT